MKKTPERTGDSETDSILDEMEQEGDELPVFAGAPEDDAGAEESDAATDEDEEADEEESEEETDAESEEDEEEEESEEEDEDGEEGEDEEKDEDDAGADDSDEEDEASMPLWKRHKIMKKKFSDAQKLISDLTSKTSEVELDTQLEAFSKKHKVSKEAAKEMIEMAASLAARQAGIDPSLKATIDRVVKRDKRDQFWAEQDKKYTSDFTSNVAPLAKRDGLDPAKVQKRLHGLAFLPENAKKSLVSLFLETYSKKGPKRKITSEGNRSHGRVSATSVEDIQPEDISDMSDDEFDEFSEALGKSSKSRIVRH